MVELTQEWLMETAGWEAVKKARALVAAGSVLTAKAEDGDGRLLVKGVVVEGRRKYATGMAIYGTTDVQCLCQCPDTRRSGQICAHAVAVAMGLVGNAAATPAASEASVSQEAPRVRLKVELRAPFLEWWGKGRIPVKLEAEAADEPLGPVAAAFFASQGLEIVAGKSELVTLDREMLAGLLAHFRGGSGLQVGGESWLVADVPCRVPVEVVRVGDGRLRLEPGGLDEGTQVLEAASQRWLCQEDGGRLLPLPEWPEFAAGILQAPVEVDFGQFVLHLDALQKAFRLTSAEGVLDEIRVRAATPSFELAFEGSLNHIAGKLRCHYGNRVRGLVPGRVEEQSSFPIADPERPLAFLDRNFVAEEIALGRLQRWGFSPCDPEGMVHLRGREAILAFFAGPLQRLESDASWSVEMGERFGHVTREVETVRPQFEEIGSGEDWFSFELNFATESGEVVPEHEIQRLLRTGQNSLRTRNEGLAAMDGEAFDDLREVLQDCNPEREGNSYRIARHHADYLRATFEAFRQTAAGEEAEDELPPVEVLEILRPYQLDGVRWMFRHAHSGQGAILADEMGLGKTVQSVALICCCKAEGGGPAMIVCPTSLLGNWRAEMKKFAPHLKVLTMHGPHRAKYFDVLDSADVVLTSYALMVRDIDNYRRHSFGLAILDEASYIKNPATKNAKSARALVADARIALTGTPIENSVRDLWSIMDFILPGYLGGRDEFRERYEIPISRAPEDSAAEQGRLRRRLKPYLLRRTKRVVATELPEKIEGVHYCELTARQTEVYKKFLERGREKISELIKKQGFERSRMSILTILLRLRQICCDLRLFDEDARGEKVEKSSAKLVALRELVQESLDGGHRILVFSQFVKMLGLIRTELDAMKVGFCYLDGSSRDRDEQVRRFQTDAGPTAFLISLKAGGYGLTLTKADTVIHFDPWWNPAVEAQATDRAHRIGQQNPVTAYKLITLGTVEEKILEMQRRKQNVIDAAIDDEAPMMRSLGRDEIESLILEE